MIHTVFSTTAAPATQWQADLLEHSWRRVRQPGELVRLVAAGADEPLPRHHHARVVGTLPWSPHPYTGDRFPAYDLAASLLEWSFLERVDGTVLLLEPDCTLRAPVETEVVPGHALATPWSEPPLSGEDPFGLGSDFAFLHRFCVNRSLPIAPVTLPILVHTRDLRRIAARWLELMGIIRSEGRADGRRGADVVAYAIAAAEAGVRHELRALGTRVDSGDDLAPIVSHRDAVPGPDLLAVLDQLARQRASGHDRSGLRPRRRAGVRDARILDRVLLELPNRPSSLALNASAAAIWELCDARRSLIDITRTLEGRFGASPGSLLREVESAVDHLESAGALVMEERSGGSGR